MLSSLTNLLGSLKELCFPPVCLTCSASLDHIQEIHLCPSCLGQLNRLPSALCSCCGIPFPYGAGGDHLCGICLKSGFHFDKARAILGYNEYAGKLVHGLKYGGRTAAFSTFSGLWQQKKERAGLCVPDMIIPVPLHRKRLQERGFNQALLLAQVFFPGSKEKIEALLLTRIRRTVPQTGLNGKERRRNLKGAFQVTAPEQLQGKAVILVDDVFTTGATVNECARVLKGAGAAQVEILTLARVTGDKFSL